VSDPESRPISSKEAESRKREIKRSGELIEKGVDVPAVLLESIPERVVGDLAAILGARVGHRDLISAAISSHLPGIVRTLVSIGIEKSSKGQQRPRKFDEAAWGALESAEQVVGLPKVVLLRAALTLLARQGVTRVDLQECRDQISGLAREREPGVEGA
jgi:hypothetical protein